MLHSLDGGSNLLILKSQNLGSSETGSFGFENKHGANTAGHADGGEEISTAVSTAVGRTDDHGSDNVGISKTTKSVGTTSNGNINLGLRSSLISLQE